MPRDLPGIRNPYVRFRPLNRPELEVASTSLWDYPSQNYGKGTQGSQLYRGATPSYVIWNVLQRFTRAGERVIDPFCGSGTTLDVCKDTGRDGRGYDIAPFRADIERADARQLPLGDATVDLAFLDPPYADNLAYSDDPDCIGKLHADDGSWRAAMGDVLREMVRVVRPGGTVAVFVCDVLQPQRGFFDLGVDVVNVGIAVGLRLVDHVAVVRRSKNLEQGRAKRASEEDNFMLRGFSHLLIFKRAEGAASSGAASHSSSSLSRGRPSAGRPSEARQSEARPLRARR